MKKTLAQIMKIGEKTLVHKYTMENIQVNTSKITLDFGICIIENLADGSAFNNFSPSQKLQRNCPTVKPSCLLWLTRREN